MRGNIDNLIPNSERTPEYRRELAAKMGRASGEARRKKKDAMEMAQTVLALAPEMPPIIEKQVKQMGVKFTKKQPPSAILIAMTAIMRKAMAGDIKALEFMLDLAGNNPLKNGDNDASYEQMDETDIFSTSDIRKRLDTMTDEQLRSYQQICEMFNTDGGQTDE